MSFSITPSTGIHSIDRVLPTAPVTRTPAADKTAPAAPTSAVSSTVDIIPSSPPDDVLKAMGAASQRYDDLAAQGKHVGFQMTDEGNRVQVQVYDLQGNTISPALAPSHAFDILAGEDE
jgi:hypothetical protein